MLPQALPVANAISLTYTPSAAYQASSYYSALLDVELTGNQREDIINVALSQVGYREGSYAGDTGGANDGSYLNYTESNYWYHNYISTDMPVGGSYAPWCATFVSWCAEMANIPSSIIGRSTVASRHSYGFDVVFYAGGSTLYSSSDNDSRFMGYNYTPQKGDLFFTRSWSHVGLVVGVSGSYVITVEGNTNSDGSAEGDGVFRRSSRLISDLYFGVPEYEEDYTSSCTYYPAHCQIKVNTATPINTQPCSVSTANNSVNLGTAPAGQTYTATGLYLNSYGNYWYRVETSYGETSYLYADDTTYVKELTSDITIKDYKVPNAHVSGNTFTVAGTISSQYNRLDTASCYIYPGFDQSTQATTGYSDSVNSTQYVLTNSNVDYNTSFGSLSTGNYTYEIATKYTNYYATGSTSISSNTGTIRLLSEYFVVIPSSVDQSSCSHSYTTTTTNAASCTTSGTAIKACSLCGIVSETTVAASGHTYGSWTTVDATCTTDGSRTHKCTVCGNVETQTITAGGHSYNVVTHAATCSEYEIYEYTCKNCGDYYTLNAGEMTSTWLDYLPTGMDSSLFNIQTQYRYSDYETKTSASASLAGYTQIGSEWVQSNTGSVQYVPSWPSGFSTSSSLYSTYNKAGSKVTASETSTAKTVVNSDTQCGYLYYHWCYTDSYYSTEYQTGNYTTFHAYYNTTDPSNYTCDTSDYSYKTSHSTCSNTNWWFVTDVYQQSYTQYQKQYTYERWTDFSNWSTTPVTASATRQVETRNVYQLKEASLGDHNYVNGTCTICGATNGDQTVTSADYYLFGYINGADYACESDYANLGIYKFVNGKLTVTFDSDSYVAVKNGNNEDWYMTNGWLGTEVTSATLYDTNTLSSADKLYVPGGVEVTFTLVVNADNTLTLSYAAAAAPVVTPTLSPKYPTLSFEDEIFINVYFTVENPGNLTTADMGLLTWSVARTDGTVDTAEANIAGATYNSSTGLYCVRTEGIAAKKLGDTVYFKIYIKLSDGSYLYSSLLNYSPKSYAANALSNGTAKQKALVVAMLNYGAAAQTYFSYKSYNLMNSSLTTAQKSLISSYSSTMISSVVQPSSSKVGIFTNSGGFSKKYPTVSFEGAFCINYYFTPSNTPSGSLGLYYWTQSDYESAATLTPGNATGKFKMTLNENGEYHGVVEDIAAKDLGRTIYVAAGYTSNGTSYCTGVLAYSIGAYCVSQAAGSSTMKDFAAATAVYSYYAKDYFTA